MRIVQELLYGLRWFLYAFSSLLHLLYQALVFLGKPGGALVLAYIAHAITLYLHWEHQGLPTFEPSASPAIWYESLTAWLTYDSASRGLLVFIEVPLLVLSVALHVFPRTLLSSALGLFPAKARPLPPMRPIRVPKFKVKTVKVRRKVRRIRKRFWRWPYSLKRRLPRDVAKIVVKPR